MFLLGFPLKFLVIVLDQEPSRRPISLLNRSNERMFLSTARRIKNQDSGSDPTLSPTARRKDSERCTAGSATSMK